MSNIIAIRLRDWLRPEAASKTFVLLKGRNPQCVGAHLWAGLEEDGGADRDRTGDPLLAKQVLSQLSYSPSLRMVGLGRFELPTSPLSGVRSNQLSYRPGFRLFLFVSGSFEKRFRGPGEHADQLRRS